MTTYHAVLHRSWPCLALLILAAVQLRPEAGWNQASAAELILERIVARNRALTSAEAALRLAMAALVTDDCDSNGTPDECDVDCNTNGSPDDLDVFVAVSRDCNENRVPDECEGIVRADLDCDGDVDAGDLAIFRACHPLPGQSAPQDCDAADVNGDGAVNCADWRAIRSSWTAGAPPNYARCRTPSQIAPVPEAGDSP